MCKMKFNTDLANERVDEYKFVNNLSSVEGIEVYEEKSEEFKVITVNVLDEKGKDAIDKEIGTYITFEMDNVKFIEDRSAIVTKLKEEIRKLIALDGEVLVIGLGNANITADALGSKVINKTEVTRHILKLADFSNSSEGESVRSVCAFAPGVMGKTGLETSEIVSAISSKINPKYIIVIDSLMSKSIERVGSSIQISNTGITPGSGISGYNSKIDSNLTNAKVISIGVPMVVDIATIANDIIDKITYTDDTSCEINLSQSRYNQITKALENENYIVTPKDIDELIDIMSNIISTAINQALDVDFLT